MRGLWTNSTGSQAAFALAASLLIQHGTAVPHSIRQTGTSDPFAVIDPQVWVNPSDMTWADFVPPPGTSWSDSSIRGHERNFNIALVLLDYPDEDFTITKAPGATIFGNPQAISADLGVTRENVSAYYRDFLNKPSALNHGHTLHEYWMEDSFGRYGVDLTAFGPYRLPNNSYQYGIASWLNPDGCPVGEVCDLDMREAAFPIWRADVGNTTAASFELVYFLSAGQDESSTWQEFGEMKFETKESVPAEFGPPNSNGTNCAKTRYVEWSSWASAAAIWPFADIPGGNSIQAESSGMGTFAHELSHLLHIGDNYNNPYDVPLRRCYTGPWGMMSRGSFNGPGGPHTRWQIPATQGGALGSLHTVHDKLILGLVANASLLTVTRAQLRATGLVLANLTARSVDPTTATGLLGLRVEFGAEGDSAAVCDTNTNLYCDGGGYDAYDVEVVDRMGADSFQADHGVLVSKTKNDPFVNPFQWVIDANPQDIEIVDFIRPNGSEAMISLGDYRQLLDALFHAGTRSGSEFEFEDADNGIAVYVLDIFRDDTGVLSYTVAFRATGEGAGSASTRGVSVAPGTASSDTVTAQGAVCSFDVSNTGSYVAAVNGISDVNLKWDVYRLKATVAGAGWTVQLPNELLAVQFGAVRSASVAVAAGADAVSSTVVELSVVSELDGTVATTAQCQVSKA